MIPRRTVTRSAVLATALLFAGGGGVAQAQAQAQARAQAQRRARAAGARTMRLPTPTGPHRTGVTTLYLVDRSRRDPWDPAIPVRELMVTVFYPARTVHGFSVAPHMTTGAAKSFHDIDVPVHRLPSSGVNWAATVTHSYTNAPAQTVRRPVLLYSPGGGDPRTLGTGIAEELASHGYAVVTIDHPGDGSEVEFPLTTAYRHEKVRETVFRGDPRTDADQFRTMIETRIADARFVLDQLAVLAVGRNPDAMGRAVPEDLGRALDLRRVGIYGHSAGGTTAAEAMYEDRRIHAAVNMEGYLDHTPETPGKAGQLFPVARYGVDRPLLLLGSEGFDGKEADQQALELSWAAMLAHQRGRTRRRQIDHAMHWVFTDYAVMAPQLQAVGLMSAADRVALVGTIEPDTSVAEVRRHVLSFFARHLPARCRRPQ
ncbi:Platelet-activating factor acetylhydrolase, isoform II [Streptomyces sp. 2112.3]|uniref:alpha/beta hydrolase family protein n=1 Tax=Streptomyces sp. 2112.3 TaxID=1881023 RepID=UPI00089B5A20|nr:alpha/beta hydrolase [Streptomyces sp. 2112.3]SEE45785.1 Platelet-activating factor acetylhydrolase, isoform II [Streptomyces sp. 2112.3]